MSAFGRPMTGRRPRMTRAHDRQKTLPTPAAVHVEGQDTHLKSKKYFPDDWEASPEEKVNDK